MKHTSLRLLAQMWHFLPNLFPCRRTTTTSTRSATARGLGGGWLFRRFPGTALDCQSQCPAPSAVSVSSPYQPAGIYNLTVFECNSDTVSMEPLRFYLTSRSCDELSQTFKMAQSPMMAIFDLTFDIPRNKEIEVSHRE